MPLENKTNRIEETRSSELPSFEGLELIGRLGDGGMSTVYKAIQSSLGRTVAVKVLSDQALGEAGILRFKNEAKNTANLDHPNIVKVYSVGVSSTGSAYILMEYIEGISLSKILSEKPPKYSRQQIGSILCQLLSGLDYAHKCGFIHRDLKPANMMIVDGRNGPEAKLVDFGIAKSLGPEGQKLTTTGTIIGTPTYMSPEQCLDRSLDLRSDLYSMACVIYECFVGRIPFDGNNSLELMYKHINATTPSAASMKNSCGAELAELLSLSLSKSPEDRPASASRMRDALEKALDTLPERVEPEKKTKEREKIRTGEKDQVNAQEKLKQDEESHAKSGEDNTNSESSEQETKPQKTPARTVLVVAAALFLLLLVLKDSLDFGLTQKNPVGGKGINAASDTGIKQKVEIDIRDRNPIPLAKRTRPEQLEYAYQSYLLGFSFLSKSKHAKERFATTINEYLTGIPRDKLPESAIEAWTHNIIASKTLDELFQLGERKAVMLKQEMADWDEALKQANLLWPKHNTSAYVGTECGQFQCMINQSKVKYSGMEELTKAEQDDLLEAQSNFLPTVEKKILEAISEQEKLAETNESPDAAIECLHQCLFDTYIAAEKIKEAERELKTLLSLDEKTLDTPGSASRHFYNLIRKAQLLPSSERQAALSEAANVVLPKTAKRKPIVEWNSQKGEYELVDGDSIANSMELLGTILSPMQRDATCEYLRALAFYESEDMTNAKLHMKKIQEHGGVVRLQGFDRKLEAELSNEEE